MKRSSDQAIGIIDEAVQRAEQRPGAIVDLFRLLERDLGPLLGRIRATAGGSQIAFAVIPPSGDLRSNSPLFDHVTLDEDVLAAGDTQFTRSTDDELVVVAPTQIPVRAGEATLLVGLAREAPVVRLADLGQGLIFVVIGIAVLAALFARLLSNQLASRLEPLASASRELADGDMSARVPDLGDPELDEVANAFNEMASELQATQTREKEFILGIGHDLRTPLTTIGGYAEALESGSVNPEDIERIGSVLGVQSRQLSRLIEDLATLARLDQPEFSLRVEPVDVGAHVTEIVEGFRRHAEEIGVNLEVDAEQGLVVETDPDRLGQISQNLVENALRFTPEMGRVLVAVEGGDDAVTIAVSDTGSGIAEADLPHVFDRHYVGAQRQVRSEGSGLGLSIVEGLVDRIGGEVSARSVLGKGTTIKVTFPV